MKICSRCFVSKDLDQYHHSGRAKDGLKPHCKACAALDDRQRRLTNADRVHALEKATRERNAASLRAHQQRKNARIRADIKARLRPPHRRDKLKHCIRESRRRSKSTGRFTAEDVNEILKSQRGRCANPRCRTKLGPKFHLDHITPLSLGGANVRRNIQIMCPTCNLRKGRKHPITFAQENGLLI